MNIFNREKRIENKKRHIKFRKRYFRKQLTVILNICLCFLLYSIVCFVFVVPAEHAKYPELGRIKYGISIVLNIIFACFSKWLLNSKVVSEDKKPVITEIFSFVLGLAYLSWGIYGMWLSMIEFHIPVVLMYLILLAVITAFLYYPLIHFVYLVIISYTFASICFVTCHDIASIDITSSICAVIMMIVLGVLSNTRYMFSRDRFEFECKNLKLAEEQELQNEELEAQNEELTAINEELNDTTEKLTKALEELENITESQKMFTSSMNHELRAPLNGIIGTIQVMMMNNQLNEEDRSNLDQCMLMSKSLLSIVNDLLDFAKMDSGEFEILPAAFDLHEIVSSIDSTFKHQADNKSLDFNIEISDDTVCGLYGDDFRIQQIVANIVSNAIKYTEKGSVTLNISYIDETLKFVISDTGQGMSEESLKYLFVPFKRIEESKNKKIQGTGLGMSIVMNLVKRMNGTINVDSTLGKGTTFTVLIPSKTMDENNTYGTIVKKENLQEIVSAVSLDGMSILYVDDMKINLKIVEKLLADTGVKMTITDSPFEGLKHAQNEAFDIIMLDHQMPEMTGPELFNEIRNTSEHNKTTPVIIFTGNAGAGTEERYKEMGFAGYICKPVLKNNLLEVLKKASSGR